MFQRKFCTGPAISPFSIRNSPSRVMPVLSSGCVVDTPRMYQKNVTSSPRRVCLIMSSIDRFEPSTHEAHVRVAVDGAAFCRRASRS